MMSAEAYRARAADLVISADTTNDLELILELEATAADWRRLADFADVQDALLKALSAMGD